MSKFYKVKVLVDLKKEYEAVPLPDGKVYQKLVADKSVWLTDAKGRVSKEELSKGQVLEMDYNQALYLSELKDKAGKSIPAVKIEGKIGDWDDSGLKKGKAT